MPSRIKYDAFICYATEDNEEVATPLAERLRIHHGLNIFYYDFSVDLGDSESQKIDEGLTNCKHGIIIASKNFFRKKRRWAKAEFYALLTRHVNSKKGIVVPILHKMSKKELAKESAQLADLAELDTSEGIDTIADKLNRKIRGIKTIYNFESGEELSPTISTLSKSIQAKESLLEEEYEEMRLVILIRIYLIAQGYRMAYIPFHSLSVSLSSSKEETMRIIEKCVEQLIHKNLIESRAWGMISITHKGIKEIENLLEKSFQKKSSTSERKKRIASQIKHSIGESKLSEVREIQRLRYDVLKQAALSAEQKDEAMNIFAIAQPLGIEKEKLDRIYFYLEDEGLTKFYAIGGDFCMTDKGLKRVKDAPNRIL